MSPVVDEFPPVVLDDKVVVVHHHGQRLHGKQSAGKLKPSAVVLHLIRKLIADKSSFSFAYGN